MTKLKKIALTSCILGSISMSNAQDSKPKYISDIQDEISYLTRALGQVSGSIESSNAAWVDTYNMQKDILINMAKILDEQSKEIVFLRKTVTLMLEEKSPDKVNETLEEAKKLADQATKNAASGGYIKKMEKKPNPIPLDGTPSQKPVKTKLTVENLTKFCDEGGLSTSQCDTLQSLQAEGKIACDGTCDGSELVSEYKKNPEAFEILKNIDISITTALKNGTIKVGDVVEKPNKKLSNQFNITTDKASKVSPNNKKASDEYQPKNQQQWKPKATPFN